MSYGSYNPNFTLGQGLNFNQFQNPQQVMDRLLQILQQSGLGQVTKPNPYDINVDSNFLQSLLDGNRAGMFSPDQQRFFQNILGGTRSQIPGGYAVGFNPELAGILQALGPDAADRLTSIFMGDKADPGMGDGRGWLYKLFGGQWDESGDKPFMMAGRDQIGQMLASGHFDDNPVRKQFLQRIMDYQPPPGGGGGGDPNGGGDPTDGGVTDVLGPGDGEWGGGFKNWSGAPKNEYLSWLEQMIRDRMSGNFGVPQDIMDANRAALHETARVGEQAQMQQLASGLNTRGQLGGGRQITASQDILNNSNTALQNAVNSMNMGNAQLAVQDRASAFNEGLGLGGLYNQRDLGFGNLDLQKLLGEKQLNLQEQLGMGQLGLATSQFQFQSMMQLFMQQLMASLGLF